MSATMYDWATSGNALGGDGGGAADYRTPPITTTVEGTVPISVPWILPPNPLPCRSVCNTEGLLCSHAGSFVLTMKSAAHPP
jgi:hypothetical protein